MGTTIVGLISGIVACAVVGGVTYLAVRLYRSGGERQQKVMRAALAAAFVISASQAAVSDGYAASLPLIFASWALVVCLAVVVVNGVRRRRRSGPQQTAH